jgi:hypothetical protein
MIPSFFGPQPVWSPVQALPAVVPPPPAAPAKKTPAELLKTIGNPFINPSVPTPPHPDQYKDIQGLASNDWITFHGPIKDGDFITLRSNAWGGTALKHTPIGVIGEQRSSNLQANNFVNLYSWTIRKIELDLVLKAWVMPTLSTSIGSRPALTKEDYFILICSGTADLVLGTRTPPPIGNNGDYSCELRQFVAVTANQLSNTGATEMAHRFVSAGMWNNESKTVDFVAQSTCVWSFHGASLDSISALSYGKAINVRNVWTEVKTQYAHIMDHGSPLALVVQRSFKGGRNLSMAAGSGGQAIKLALTNQDGDDKAIWWMDSWNGHQYPVPRVLRTTEPAPPYTPQTNPTVPADKVTYTPPDTLHMVTQPNTNVPGLTYDPVTGMPSHRGLETRTQNQDKRGLWEKFLFDVFGIVWADVSYIQIGVALAIVLVALPALAYVIHDLIK